MWNDKNVGKYIYKKTVFPPCLISLKDDPFLKENKNISLVL